MSLFDEKIILSIYIPENELNNLNLPNSCSKCFNKPSELIYIPIIDTFFCVSCFKKWINSVNYDSLDYIFQEYNYYKMICKIELTNQMNSKIIFN